MNSIGLCHHNNVETYCPTCVRSKAFGKRRAMAGTMGATCQPGYYELKIAGISTGQCLPTLSTAASGAQAGASGTLVTGVATSPANVTAAQQAVYTAGVSSVASYIKNNPIMVASVVGGIILLGLYGTMSFARGR